MDEEWGAFDDLEGAEGDAESAAVTESVPSSHDAKAKGRGRGRGGARSGNQKVKNDKLKAAAGDNLCQICPAKKVSNGKYCRCHERVVASLQYQADRDGKRELLRQVVGASPESSATCLCVLSCICAPSASAGLGGRSF